MTRYHGSQCPVAGCGEDFKNGEIFQDSEKRELAEHSPLYLCGATPSNEREILKNQFDVGDSKILIATEAGERGLNLQIASVIINMDLPFNPAKLKQRIGRIYRIGSKHETIRVINLLTNDTVEERVLKLLEGKRDIFLNFFKLDSYDPIMKLGSDELKKLL